MPARLDHPWLLLSGQHRGADPGELETQDVVMSAEDAQKRLVRPDFEAIGPNMPRLTTMIVRALKG
ncbi:hypothetical protein GCM10011504_05710 [Siccirubricoccus deserti]|nr:hypothetical protein GCM10011504_05710 [Siccirubricoccus deserti]